MTRFTFAFIACLITPIFLNAQYPNLINSNTVTLIGYWTIGEIRTYHVTNTEKSFKGSGDKPDQISSESYDVSVKVIDSSATSYTMEMVYRNFKSADELPEYMRKMEAFQNNLVIRYKTDEMGAFDTITNLPQLKEDLMAKLVELKKIFPTGKLSAKDQLKFDQVYETFLANFEAIENIQAIFLEDIVELHGYYGLELKLNTVSEVELWFPVLIGDEVVSGEGALTLNTINKTADECSISINGNPNPDELKNYMNSIFELMFGEESKVEKEDFKVSLSSRSKIKMELSSGWMNAVSTMNISKVSAGNTFVKKEVSREMIRM